MSPCDKSTPSDSAKKREQEARALFLAAKKSFESKFLATLTPGSTHIIRLLSPAHHLTSANASVFTRFVKKHAGWRTRRRQATDAEKKAFKATNPGKR